MQTGISPASDQARIQLPGETLTRCAVTVITAAIMVMAFAFSLGNVAKLCVSLGVTGWMAWLVGPAVDLSVVGLVIGVRFLSLHGYTDEQLRKPRRWLQFCGIITLALNTAGALGHRQFGTALVDAVGPALMIGWSEIGPWLLRQVYAVCSTTGGQKQAEDEGEGEGEGEGAEVLALLPEHLLDRARTLDAEHRIMTGRPISRDRLREQMRIGRDRAGALVSAVRAEVAVAEGEQVPTAA
jgi:hypothetical protein